MTEGAYLETYALSGIDEIVVASIDKDADIAALANSNSIIERQSQTVVVEDDAAFESAAEYVKAIKAQAKKVVDFFKPMKESAFKAHRLLCERESLMLKPLKTAEDTMQKAMGAYRRMKEEERRRIENEIKRLAEEEAYRKLQEAQKLADAGKHEESKALEADAIIVDNAAAAMTLQSDVPKVKGVYQTTDYAVTVVDPRIVPLAINGVEIRPIDLKAVKQLAKMSKGKIQIPGIIITEEVDLRVRGGKINV